MFTETSKKALSSSGPINIYSPPWIVLKSYVHQVGRLLSCIFIKKCIKTSKFHQNPYIFKTSTTGRSQIRRYHFMVVKF